LLNQLKEKGYKVVHMKAKTPLATIAQWDEAAKGEIKGVIGGDRPTSSVIRTIDETTPSSAAATQTAPAKK
jgi:peptidoglycan-N-acetylglucosamine deacetylase